MGTVLADYQDAMWLWENRSVVEAFDNAMSHPTNIRKAYRRELGYKPRVHQPTGW